MRDGVICPLVTSKTLKVVYWWEARIYFYRISTDFFGF